MLEVPEQKPARICNFSLPEAQQEKEVQTLAALTAPSIHPFRRGVNSRVTTAATIILAAFGMGGRPASGQELPIGEKQDKTPVTQPAQWGLLQPTLVEILIEESKLNGNIGSKEWLSERVGEAPPLDQSDRFISYCSDLCRYRVALQLASFNAVGEYKTVLSARFDEADKSLRELSGTILGADPKTDDSGRASVRRALQRTAVEGYISETSAANAPQVAAARLMPIDPVRVAQVPLPPAAQQARDSAEKAGGDKHPARGMFDPTKQAALIFSLQQLCHEAALADASVVGRVLGGTLTAGSKTGGPGQAGACFEILNRLGRVPPAYVRDLEELTTGRKKEPIKDDKARQEPLMDS
ncbi:MAG: hypothetical protein DCC75_09125 [Proteobacteria bacterium]|nr:MAG: hypothetical protein DCC75_09125 [Pseudomonadota bacterium]